MKPPGTACKCILNWDLKRPSTSILGFHYTLKPHYLSTWTHRGSMGSISEIPSRMTHII